MRRSRPGLRGAAIAGGTGLKVLSRPVALALLVVLALVWGVHWAVVKIGLGYMPPLSYAALRLFLGLVTVVIVLGARGGLRLPPRSDLPIVLSVAFGQVASGILIINFVILTVGAGRSSVLQFTMPLWVAALQLAVFRIRLARNEAIGLLLGIVGLVALFNPAVVDWTRPGEVVGMVALLVNAVMWAGVTIHIRRHTWASSPFVLQPWQLLAAFLPVAVAAFAVEGFQGIDWQPQTVLVLLYSGPLATGFGFWASQVVTRALGPQAGGTGFLAVPVVGLTSGALLLGEAIGPLDIVAFVLLLAGVGIASLWPSRAARIAGAA